MKLLCRGPLLTQYPEVFTCICIISLYLISGQLIDHLLLLSAWICTNLLLLATQWRRRRWNGSRFSSVTVDKGVPQRRPLWSLMPFTKHLVWAKSCARFLTSRICRTYVKEKPYLRWTDKETQAQELGSAFQEAKGGVILQTIALPTQTTALFFGIPPPW